MTVFRVTTLTDENNTETGLTFDGTGAITGGTVQGTGLSLREAIALANANPDADTILFDGALDGGTMTIGSAGQLIINESLTIDASALSSGLTISGGSTHRIFFIDADGDDVVLNNLALEDGSALGGAGADGTNGAGPTAFGGPGGGGLGAGAGVFLNDGNLTLTDVSFANNTATGGAGGSNSGTSIGAGSGSGGGGLGGNGSPGGQGAGAAPGSGGGFTSSSPGGAGDFIGGNGGYNLNAGYNGGFGGGGGGGGGTGVGGGTGGFGGGDAGASADAGAGGGDGLGANIFIRDGGNLTISTTSNAATGNGTVQAGSGGTGQTVNGSDGDAAGADIFAQGAGNNITVNVASGVTLQLQGQLSDETALSGGTNTSGINKTGAGTLEINNAAVANIDGSITVNAGALAINGAITSDSTIVVNDATSLISAGGTTNQAVSITDGGTISAGTIGTIGVMTIGNLILASGGVITVDAADTDVAGTDFDQLNVNGTVNLGGSTLTLALDNNFATNTAVGDSFIILNNDGSDAITGTFDGLSEGSTFTVNSVRFSITYAGGTNSNDVEITRVALTPPVGGGSSSTGTPATNPENEVINAGITGDNTFAGGAGDDQLNGNFRDDILYGNTGADSIEGGTGFDTLFGGQGNDLVRGGTGQDDAFGNTGNDVVYGNQGDDNVYGGQGSDTLFGGQDNDDVSGGTGDDTLFGNNGNDVVYGNQGTDNLYGGQGDDDLYGGQGDDNLYGGAGNDALTGGGGADMFHFDTDDGGSLMIDDFDQGEGDMIVITGDNPMVSTSVDSDETGFTVETVTMTIVEFGPGGDASSFSLITLILPVFIGNQTQDDFDALSDGFFVVNSDDSSLMLL